MNISILEVVSVGQDSLKAKLIVGEHTIETGISVQRKPGVLIFSFHNPVFNAIVERAFITSELCNDIGRFLEENGRPFPWEYGDINYPILNREVAKQFPEGGIGITAVENDYTEKQKPVQAFNGATP
jgi:hypothetical protein